MKNKREIVYLSLFTISLFIIILNFGIHIARTIGFNQKERIVTSAQNGGDCSFNIHFRGGVSDSWLKKDVYIDGYNCTLKGVTFDGVMKNNTAYEISKWKLRININEDCFLNNSWCGTLEIHQKDKVQTLDLRNFKRDDVILEAVAVDQDFLIPLTKGDFIIYHPSEDAVGELPVPAFNGVPGTVTIGFIFYHDTSYELKFSDFSVDYYLKKGFFQGTEPVIFIVLMILWLILLIVRVVFQIAFKKAKNLQYIKDMEDYGKRLHSEVEAKTAHIKEIQQKVVVGLAGVIGNRDEDTGGHVKRTSDIIKIIVEEFRKQNPGVIDDEKAGDICRAAPMHDLGKIYIEESILCKPGKLTDEEFSKMKMHAVNSGEIVKIVLDKVEEPHFVETAFNVARHHHERWDGKGYPDGLACEEIPLEARLMSVADVYDALVSRRCYKQSLSFDKAFDIMCQGMGSQFDPQMKTVFIACRQQLEDYYSLHNE